ncbi:uncharacterized protein G2W53_033498 [Senna tora]|uniref:Uncharacterized protein n=1 Tax=Senna tora TaxID=362788 RepID=A0A834T2B2_9FABA|nr:uncharacterized protein G2W53_033498 [Senna tora]
MLVEQVEQLTREKRSHESRILAVRRESEARHTRVTELERRVAEQEKCLANAKEVEAQRQYIAELNRQLTDVNRKLKAAEQRIKEIISKNTLQFSSVNKSKMELEGVCCNFYFYNDRNASSPVLEFLDEIGVKR